MDGEVGERWRSESEDVREKKCEVRDGRGRKGYERRL